MQDKPRGPSGKLICADESCQAGDGHLDLSEILLFTGEIFRCPYCRGYKFKVIKDDRTN